MLRRIKSFVRNGWSAVLKFLAESGFIALEPSAGYLKKYSIMHAGLKRTFKIYFPEKKENENLLKPLVIALHGRGGNGDSMILLTRNGLNSLADHEGFYVLYPEGIGMNWNDGRRGEKVNDRAHLENIDDTGFISLLIDLMIKDHNTDPGRVYVTGISNGAIMAFRLACELSGKIMAIAPVDGSMPENFLHECTPGNPISVLAINNTRDPLVPYNGGSIHAGLTRKNLGNVLSVDESINFWVSRNHCNQTPGEKELPGDNINNIRVTGKFFFNGMEGTGVVLYTIHGGGHTWPGGLQYLPSLIIGRTCRTFNANRIIWDFFKHHSKRLQEAMDE
ncbi:MAG TPA: PHB depolymerase family esterase [Bacteroidales bacterium]|nr:PHB depolymerase family esterase [Bacteroidales bacterium]